MESGLTKAAKENTDKAGTGYCGICGRPPPCNCASYRPDAAATEIPGSKTVLDAGFGGVEDEHGSEMFKGLKQTGGK